jgi:single-stranded-DNA-specific exonuclease
LKSLSTEALHGLDLRQTLSADIDLVLSDLKPELLQQLEYLQPTGYGNPEAVFVSRNVRLVNSRTIGADGKHIKLVVADDRVTFDCIGFRLGHLHPGLPTRVDLLYTFELNEYNGRKSLQLNLKDVKPSGLLD